MNIKDNFRNWKNKFFRIWQWISGESILIWMWWRNLWVVFISSKSRIRIFEGWLHWWFAQKYANKRYRISRINKYCGGKRHYVIPAGEYSLIVVNHEEILNLKKKGYYKSLDIYKILKLAYYVTK
jgi:hypothetical protein